MSFQQTNYILNPFSNNYNIFDIDVIATIKFNI